MKNDKVKLIVYRNKTKFAHKTSLPVCSLHPSIKSPSFALKLSPQLSHKHSP